MENQENPLLIIKNQVEEWTYANIGSDFTFRKNQLETIVHIVNSIVNEDVRTHVIQAPTGTGKSLMCIISAGVLAKYYDKRSYILASDLFLWKQYSDAIDKFRLRDFGYLKGSIGNYRCDITHTDYQTGRCRVQKVSIASLRNREQRHKMGYDCADTCLYMRQRFRAERTPVTLLTYQLWLYQMNLVEHEDNTGFTSRPVIFCDECHNIPDIVSLYAKPLIDVENDRKKLRHILRYAAKNDTRCPFSARCFRPDKLRDLMKEKLDSPHDAKKFNIADYVSMDSVMDNYELFIDALGVAEMTDAGPQVRMSALRDFSEFLYFMGRVAENALEDMAGNAAAVMNDKDKKKHLNDFKILSWMHNYESNIKEFMSSVSMAGADSFVVEENIDRVLQRVTYTLNCVKEDHLCYNYLMVHAKYKVMTSATVGNKQHFATSIGYKFMKPDEKMIFTDVPNIFDFSKSPIYFMPQYKMSYQNKNFDFPKIQQIIYRILSSEAYMNVRGMINTGSYDNARAIYQNAPPNVKQRLCMYLTSKDKADVIERYTHTKNKVLIGPTLVEGVDLPDDLCRFIIIVKMPYPNISSKVVKAKMNLFPLWYSSATSNLVIQNIGRGVRNENDWCTTFILDGCFQKLFETTAEQYPPEMRARIQVINS